MVEFKGILKDAHKDLLKGVWNLKIEVKELASEELDEIFGKEKKIIFKNPVKVRSTNANAYMWTLLSKMAEKLNVTKDDLYLQVLMDYGTSVILPITEENKDVLKMFRVVSDYGKSSVVDTNGNNVDCTNYRCWKGSSLYNNKEMRNLIDKVVGEAKQMNIETLTPNELLELKERWGV